MKLALVFAAAAAVLATAPDARAQWVDARNQSCDVACRPTGRPAAVSGFYVNGRPLFICAASAGNQGFRAGYNLRPHSPNACTVGWGGRELAHRPYSCLCSRIGPV